MKKLLCFVFLLSSMVSFSNTYSSDHHKYNNHRDGYYYHGNGYYCCNRMYHADLDLSENDRREINLKQIAIQEKELQLEKLLNSEVINWDEVEKLNKEIGLLKGEYYTYMLKLLNEK